MLDLEELASLDLRLKDIIDENKSACSCDNDLFKWINQMLIIRKGISFDIQNSDDAGGIEKMELLSNLLDAGTNFNCGC